MTYDFIVVGAGPAGITIATRLAGTAQKPRVLLLEAGKAYPDARSLFANNKCIDVPNAAMPPEAFWKYETVEQKALGGKKYPLAMGKALGGGTAVNWMFFLHGPDSDYDQWAKIVGDDAFSSKSAKEIFRRIEDVAETDDSVPEGWHDIDHAIRGKGGAVRVELGGRPAAHGRRIMKAFTDAGLPLNPDQNTGNPVGLGLGAYAQRGHVRITAAEAYLKSPPQNLEIRTETRVEKILFEGSRAVGVQIGDEKVFAAKEVILSAGAIKSAQLLMVSGVGPKNDLEKLKIPVIQDLPVGQGLQDHPRTYLVWEMKDGFGDSIAWLLDPARARAAREEFLEKGTGPFAEFSTFTPILYTRDQAVLDSPEFAALPADTKEYLSKPDVPLLEVVPLLPSIPSDPAKRYMVVGVFPFATQSEGSVRLSSADINDPPLIDPAWYSHPFDCRNAAISYNATKKLIESTSLKNEMVSFVGGPAGESDEEVMAFIAEKVNTMWHFCGDVKMGKKGDKKTCVDSDFKVLGVQGLRVADMSVTPIAPNTHLQPVGYFIGEVQADKLIAEYGLDEGKGSL